MLKRIFGPVLAAMILVPTAQVSTARTSELQNSEPSATLKARFSRLRRGINLSHWFAQSGNDDYSKAHLESHAKPADLTLIKNLGFDHVRFTIEPAPLFNEWDDPAKLNVEYLKYLDTAVDNMLSRDLAVIIDIHPSDPFKVRLNTEDRHVEAFAKFWTSLAKH